MANHTRRLAARSENPLGQMVAAAIVLTLLLSTASAVDLRSEFAGSEVVRRVNYEWSGAPAEVIPITGPEQVIGIASPDGAVLPASECGPHGCGVPMSCGPACGGCPSCGLCGFWGGVEFLNWWHRSNVAPALATDGPLPGATVFAGQERLFDDSRVGMRMTLGWWAGQSHRPWGLLGRWYVVDDAEYNFSQTADGVGQILSRPFFNLAADITGATIGNDAFDVALGNVGTIDIDATSSLQGGDMLLRWVVRDNSFDTTDVLAGYTTALIDESIEIRSELQLAPTLVAFDRFVTRNRFHGASVGFLTQSHFDAVSFEMLAKLSFGSMHQEATVVGQFDGAAGGLLAQPGNSGDFEQDVFAVSPEVGINLVFQPNPSLDFVLGYSFLYWSSVAQAADIIDPLLRVSPNNPLAANDLPQPPFEFRNSDLVVHGINVGLRFSY